MLCFYGTDSVHSELFLTLIVCVLRVAVKNCHYLCLFCFVF